MTLSQTLQIKERFLKFEDIRALDYVERRWKESGEPTERWEIINFLERMLQELKSGGVGYPKVLLLRKKEIQRRTFTPQFEHTSPEEQAQPGFHCVGGWHLPTGGGAATKCDCPKRMTNRCATV